MQLNGYSLFNTNGRTYSPSGKWYIDDGGEEDRLVAPRNVRRQDPTYVPFQSTSDPYAGYGWQGAAQYPYPDPGGIGYGNGRRWAQRRPDGANRYQTWVLGVRGIDYR